MTHWVSLFQQSANSFSEALLPEKFLGASTELAAYLKGLFQSKWTLQPVCFFVDRIKWHHLWCAVADCRCTVVLLELRTCRCQLLVGINQSNNSKVSVISIANKVVYCQFYCDEISTSRISYYIPFLISLSKLCTCAMYNFLSY